MRGGSLAPTALMLLSVLMISACGTSSPDPTLILYSGQHQQTVDGLVSAFEAQTGITVEVRSDDEDVLADQILQEGSHSPADLFMTENSPALELLQEKGLLAGVAPSTLDAVPAADSSPQGDWVGVTARVSVIVYNPSLVPPSQVPTSVMQLASPAWRGKLALAPGETDFQPIVTSVDRQVGDAATVSWLDALKNNAGNNIYPDNETIVSEVNSGRAAIGVINNYYWYRERAEFGTEYTHCVISLLAPHDPGYIVDVAGAAVLRSSHAPADAQRFLAFLVSSQAQRIIAAGTSFEYPLVAGVAPAGDQPALTTLQPAPLTVSDLGDGEHAVALLQQAQLL